MKIVKIQKVKLYMFLRLPLTISPLIKIMFFKLTFWRSWVSESPCCSKLSSGFCDSLGSALVFSTPDSSFLPYALPKFGLAFWNCLLIDCAGLGTYVWCSCLEWNTNHAEEKKSEFLLNVTAVKSNNFSHKPILCSKDYI